MTQDKASTRLKMFLFFSVKHEIPRSHHELLWDDSERSTDDGLVKCVWKRKRTNETFEKHAHLSFECNLKIPNCMNNIVMCGFWTKFRADSWVAKVVALFRPLKSILQIAINWAWTLYTLNKDSSKIEMISTSLMYAPKRFIASSHGLQTWIYRKSNAEHDYDIV